MSAKWKMGVTAAGSLVIWSGNEWRWAERHRDYPPPDSRPLVLIDPEDRDQVERLRNLLAYHLDMQAALREYASSTPPKPDEPMGLGAVVVDADGVKWVRVSEGDNDSIPWLQGGSAVAWRNYADISAVESSAGVES